MLDKPPASSIEQTLTEMTRNDFISRGPNGGYFYPFSGDIHDFSQMTNSPWKGSLPETCRGEDGIYRKPGFDLARTVAALQGPILEIGGPSSSGYEFLRRVELPVRPFMTNILGSRRESKGFDSLIAFDKLVLDALADVHNLPIADQSLGMVLASNINKISTAEVKAINASASTVEEAMQNYPIVIAEVYARAKDAIDEGNIKMLSRQQESPRIAMLAQASRTLKPNGLLVMTDAMPEDVEIASTLGLELIMHAPNKRSETKRGVRETIREAVFQKTIDPIAFEEH